MKKSKLIMNWEWQRLRFSAKFVIYAHKLERRKGRTEIISAEDRGTSEETLEEAEPGGLAALKNLWHSVVFRVST